MNSASIASSFLQPTHLQNDLVKLAPIGPDDFERLYQVASDPLIWEQHPSPDRHKREVFPAFFDGAIQSKSAFLILDAATGATIGSTRFYDFLPEAHSIAIGYTFLARAYWGGHYNSSLKSLMLHYIFEYVDTVLFHVGAQNIRSQKAVLKLGAKKVAEMEREFSGRKNMYHEYALSKADWQTRQG